jgi:hypothetical protein
MLPSPEKARLVIPAGYLQLNERKMHMFVSMMKSRQYSFVLTDEIDIDVSYWLHPTY